MSLNVTYDQCYYGIVKMRDETEARIPLLPILLATALQPRGGDMSQTLHEAGRDELG